MNMLLAILMESYSTVKEAAGNADSLFQAVENMIRRARQNKRGERVKLDKIWDGLMEDADGDDEAVLNSERYLTPEMVMNLVPGLQITQAKRTLDKSQELHDKLNE